MRRALAPTPIHVQLILSDLCNQDCGFCAYRMSSGLSTELFGTEKTHNPNRKIPTDKALSIIDECADLGVKAIQFTGGGEPTVHPDHLRIFRHAQILGIKTALVTNGIKLDPDAPEILSMDWIRVSVDAGTPQTYAGVRRVASSHWDRVWKNVKRLSDNYTGRLGIGFVVTPQNYLEVGKAAMMARAHGATNLRVGAVFSKDGVSYYGDLIPEIIESINDAKAQHDTNGFEVIDLFGRRLGDLEGGSPSDATCFYQHLTVYIGGDQNVYRCCNTAYTKAGLVGSLEGSALAEIIRTYLPFDARQCRYCQFIGQNTAIRSLVKEPADVDFV